MTDLEQPAAAPMAGRHPVVDEFGEGFVVFATPVPTVRFTEPFAAFVAEALARGVRPVLVTRVDAQVSVFVSQVMGKAGGVWAVQARDGATFDVSSGYRVRELADLWEQPDAAGERLEGFTDPPVRRHVLAFDVRTRQRAIERSRVGLVAEVVAEVAGVRWECWGTREPLLDVWDVEALTRCAREMMPESPVMRAVGTGGALCHVQVARTQDGLLEHTWGAVPVDAAQVDEVARLVAERVAKEHLPTVALFSAGEHDQAENGTLVRQARQSAPQEPVAGLVGPTLVGDLGADLEALVGEHVVSRVGRGRFPSLLVRFPGQGLERWQAAARFVAALGVQDVARVVRGGA